MPSFPRHRGLSLLFRLAVPLCFAAAALPARAQVAEVPPDDLRRWLDEGRDILVVDTRPRQEFERKRIGNALNLPAFAIGGRRLPRDRTLVLYDDGVGTREARQAAEKLAEAGHTNVQLLRGGLAAWEARGHPIVAPRGLTTVPLVDTIAAAQLAQARADGVPLAVIDLRTEDEYRAGHLAGAVHGPPIHLDQVLAGVPPDQIVILYDNGSGEALQQAERLRRRGHRVVRYLYGGMPAWLEKKLPLEATP